MIIKKRHVPPRPTQVELADRFLSGDSPHLSNPEAGPADPAAALDAAWNLKAVLNTDAPDRRGLNRPPDRRNLYRRVEEKELISKANEESNAIRESARRIGFEEGLEDARETLAHIQEQLQELMLSRQEALLSIVEDIAPVAVEVAERIVKAEVSCDETLVLGMVRDTLQKAGRRHKSILIKVHPDDLYRVKQLVKTDEPIPNLEAELIVMDDAAVDRGSCIVETNSGLIDATFSTKLQILKSIFGPLDLTKPAISRAGNFAEDDIPESLIHFPEEIPDDPFHE